MSQTLIPKLADDRSTSKSADSHTISAPNELANVSQEPANPTGGTQAASHILATGSVVKTEPFPASVHGVSSAGLNLQQSNTQKPLDKRGVSITSTPQTIAQPNAHAHSAGQITASQPLPPGSIAPGQPLPVSGQAVAPQQPNGVLQGQLGQLPKPSIPSHLQNRAAAGNQPHLGGLQSRASGIVHQNGQPVQPMHAVGGQAMQTQPNGVKPGKIVSINDIQRVQNYIEKCLQLYLSQKEVVQQLEQQCQIEPCFTQLVWQKLEEQNQEFFRAYYTRLKLKDQIVLFNHLLDEQVKMLSRMPRPASGHTVPTSNAMMQPVVSAPSHQYPQQRLGAPVQVASSQPLSTSQAMPSPFPAEAPGNHQVLPALQLNNNNYHADIADMLIPSSSSSKKSSGATSKLKSLLLHQTLLLPCTHLQATKSLLPKELELGDAPHPAPPVSTTQTRTAILKTVQVVPSTAEILLQQVPS